MELVLLILGMLMGGVPAYAWQQHQRAKLERDHVLIPRATLGKHLEISTGTGELMCPHCNGMLQETVEAALLISIKHPDEAEIKVYRNFASRHPGGEYAAIGTRYPYQEYIFPFEVPAPTKKDITKWVYASEVAASYVQWSGGNTLKVFEPMVNIYLGEAAPYPEGQRQLDHQRMIAGLRKILRIPDLQLYDPRKEVVSLPEPVIKAELSLPS